MLVHRKALVLPEAFLAVARVRLRLPGREHRRLGSQKAAAPRPAQQRGKRAALLRSTGAPPVLPQKLRRRPRRRRPRRGLRTQPKWWRL